MSAKLRITEKLARSLGYKTEEGVKPECYLVKRVCIGI